MGVIALTSLRQSSNRFRHVRHRFWRAAVWSSDQRKQSAAVSLFSLPPHNHHTSRLHRPASALDHRPAPLVPRSTSPPKQPAYTLFTHTDFPFCALSPSIVRPTTARIPQLRRSRRRRRWRRRLTRSVVTMQRRRTRSSSPQSPPTQ